MNKERIKMWIDALRSDEYVQGRGKLCNNGRYCCLGVATALYIQVENEHGNIQPLNLLDGLYMPLIVAEWYGIPKELLSYRDQVVAYDGFMGRNSWSLWLMNDQLNKNFKEIADVIEARLLNDGYLKEE